MAIRRDHAREIVRNALRSGNGVEDIAVRVTGLGDTQAKREARVREFIAEMRAEGVLTPEFFAPLRRRVA